MSLPAFICNHPVKLCSSRKLLSSLDCIISPCRTFCAIYDNHDEGDFESEIPRKSIHKRGQSRRSILERKLLSSTGEGSVLTWRGRTQLLKLAKEYTDNELDVSSLTSLFPITEVGIQKMMRTYKSHRIHPPSKTIFYNNVIIGRWATLTKFIHQFIKEPISDTKLINEMTNSLPVDLWWILEESKLHLLAYAHGNPSLPFYPDEEKLPVKFESPVVETADGFTRLAVEFGDPPSNRSEDQKKNFLKQQDMIENNICSFEALKQVGESRFHLPFTELESAFRFYKHMHHCARLLFLKPKQPLNLPNRIGLSFHKHFKTQKY